MLEQEIVVSFGERSGDYSYVAPWFRSIRVDDMVTVNTTRGEVPVLVVAVYPSIRESTKNKGLTLAAIGE